ncbi:hypothetical protein Vadar_031890 [Vaccinium darrowii]|uniref:Uncharacterized protein n=1 Tax=Vaccinium darrowii TaxID=229202 RepID=A0ACB7ZFT8_9ERIC|nr:hypothetical protein Vadar_031890 [Vaccinium darrowii]
MLREGFEGNLLQKVVVEMVPIWKGSKEERFPVAFTSLGQRLRSPVTYNIEEKVQWLKDIQESPVDSRNPSTLLSCAINSTQAREFGVGSVFTIDSEGYLLGCAHSFYRMKLNELCVAQSVFANSIDGVPRIEPAELIALAPSRDLALLKVSLAYVKDYHIFEFCEPMEVGSSVFCLGNTVDVRYMLREGIVSTLPLPWSNFTKSFKKGASLVPDVVPEDFKLIELDLGACLGFSGTPAFNLIGRTMGIISCGSHSTTFCIPSAIA